MAKTHSCQKFVSICLHDHIIPKCLQIKTQPCVPKSTSRELASRLQKSWTWIIERTCRDFLTALKLYHRGCAYNLQHQADDLEVSVEARFGRTRMRLTRKELKLLIVVRNSIFGNGVVTNSINSTCLIPVPSELNISGRNEANVDVEEGPLHPVVLARVR